MRIDGPAFGVLLLLLTSTHVAAADGIRERRWREDLDHLGLQLELRHPDLYHSISRAGFRAGLDEIRDTVDSTSDLGIALAMARLLARVGDGHTSVPLLQDSLPLGRLPVEFIRTADGLSVLAADSSLSDVVGSAVLKIGILPATEALDSVAALLPYDNSWTAWPEAATHATVPEILHALGITGSANAVRLEIRDRAGRRREIVLEPLDDEASIRWDYGPYERAAPGLARRNDPYWLTVLPGDSVVCVQFNRADRDKEDETLAQFGTRLLGMVREGSIRRVVVDLRWNHGGSRWRARHLLGALIAVEHELGASRSTRARTPSGRLVTLISPETFSAATYFALDLEQHTNTAFVGQPTGGKPNYFGELGRFKLPHSGLEIQHSIYRLQGTHPRDTRPALFPDREVPWTASDVSAGRDPQMEAALSWHPLPSEGAEMERRVHDNGIEAALAWLDSLNADPSSRLQITEDSLNRLGYGLLQEGQSTAAARIFQWLLSKYPWSANAHDSLADAYLALGRKSEAEDLLCKAFVIDPQYSRVLDRGVRCGRALGKPTTK